MLKEKLNNIEEHVINKEEILRENVSRYSRD